MSDEIPAVQPHHMDIYGAHIVGALVDMFRADAEEYRPLVHDLVHAACGFYGVTEVDFALAKVVCQAMATTDRMGCDLFELHRDGEFWTYSLTHSLALEEESAAAYDQALRTVCVLKGLLEDLQQHIGEHGLRALALPDPLDGQFDAWIAGAPSDCDVLMALAFVTAVAVDTLVSSVSGGSDVRA